MKKILTEKDFINTKDNTTRCQMLAEIASGQAIFKDTEEQIKLEENMNHIPHID